MGDGVGVVAAGVVGVAAVDVVGVVTAGVVGIIICISRHGRGAADTG